MTQKYEYEKWKYGLFVHYIACYAFNSDWEKAENAIDAAEGFEVEDFADDVAKMNVEYVIFTAWHANVQPLYPSEVTKRWRKGINCAERDLIGEVIDALNSKGIHVILYTHPRDGHDFNDEDRLATGWGLGHDMTVPHCTNDTPDFTQFNYEKWNKYMTEMYAELLERYGDRIEGIWVDGMGPGRFGYGFEGSNPYKYPIVNYLDIRRIIKNKNPRIATIQNMTGDRYNCDFIMPEMYYGMEKKIPYDEWTACTKALALCPFRGWSPCGKKGEDVKWIEPEKLIEFAVLQSTSTSGGGLCCAASPYRGGEWETGVVEAMTKLGNMVEQLGESIEDTVPSKSWETISGDSLKSKNFVCASSSKDGKYEFIHILKMPENGEVLLPKPADGAEFARPRIICGKAKIKSFVSNENGVRFVLEGGNDSFDNVIKLDRTSKQNNTASYWINDTEQEIAYYGEWAYYCYCGDKQWCKGCYENDEHSTKNDGDKLQFSFDGNIVEIYGMTGKEWGTGDVLVDNMLAGRINENSDEYNQRALLFRSDNLFGGTHTVKIVKTSGEKLSFDAARIIRFE